MALNYAEKWQPELIDILIQGTLTSPFITTNVRWLDAKTFHFTQMSTSGYKEHSRQGGWNRGTYSQTDVPFTVTHDRDVEFLVDKADVDETNKTASIQNITEVFISTRQVPETDAYFFSKVAALAKTANLSTSTALSGYTKENVFSKIKQAIGHAKLRRYKQGGGLICYVRTELMDLLELSSEFTSTVNLSQVASGGRSIETRVTSIDGVSILEVIDIDRFCDKFEFTHGFAPAADSHYINILVATPRTTFTVPKIASIYTFAPGEHTQGDGWLYQNRAYWDTFVMPNGVDGKVDSIYADVDTATVTSEDDGG